MTLDPSGSPPIRALFTRYLAGFGPASVEDFAHFVLHRRATVREALEEGDDDEFVIREGPDGRPLYDLAEASLPTPRHLRRYDFSGCGTTSCWHTWIEVG